MCLSAYTNGSLDRGDVSGEEVLQIVELSLGARFRPPSGSLSENRRFRYLPAVAQFSQNRSKAKFCEILSTCTFSVHHHESYHAWHDGRHCQVSDPKDKKRRVTAGCAISTPSWTILDLGQVAQILGAKSSPETTNAACW